MLQAPLKSVSEFVRLIAEHGGVAMTPKHASSIASLITGMVLLGSFHVNRLATLFFNGQTTVALHAMLRRAKIPIAMLFWGALKLTIKTFKIGVVSIVIDDTERERSKNCKLLPFVRKAVCKATGGWIQAQNIVFILLVTERVTIPVWFCFHRPAILTKEQKKISRKRPEKIKEFDPKYRTKVELARIGLAVVARLLKRLDRELSIALKVSCVSGDNGFASASVQATVSNMFDCPYISKANPKQNVIVKTAAISLESFFNRISAVTKTINIRGRAVSLEYRSARVFVASFNRKVLVVSIRYSGEKAWQYLFGTDLTWTSESVIKGYGLRWLVEVFFEDWKQCDGWGAGGLQRSVDGAVRGLFLSLLVDLFLLYYQHTNASLQEHGRVELCSAGTVVRQLQAKAIHEAIEGILDHDNPRTKLKEIYDQMTSVIERRVSMKHAANFGPDELGPSPHLKSVWGRRNREEKERQRSAMKAKSSYAAA